MNVVGMAVVHTGYILNEKTTNESIKKMFRTADNQYINPYSKSKFQNWLNIVLGPLHPPTIDYRKLIPSNYFDFMQELYNDLRSKYMPDSMLKAIPNLKLAEEITHYAAHNNDLFQNQYDAINKPEYMKSLCDRHTAKHQHQHGQDDDNQVTNALRGSDNVAFCVDGYECGKRYVSLKIKPVHGIDAYWKHIYQYNINNIVFLIDKPDEKSLKENYKLLKESANMVFFDIHVKYESTYKYSNFTVSTFRISQLDKLNEEEKRVNVYRFWMYKGDCPAYIKNFSKFLRFINWNNPVFNKVKSQGIRNAAYYPRDTAQNLSSSNYVLHSDTKSCVQSFILYDHVCDELRYTSHFLLTDIMAKLSRDAVKSDQLLSITKEQFIFSYYLAYDFGLGATTEIANEDVSKQIKFIMKTGILTKRMIIADQFDLVFKSVEMQRKRDCDESSKHPIIYLKDASWQSLNTFSIYEPSDLLIWNSESAETHDPMALVNTIASHDITCVFSLNTHDNKPKPLFDNKHVNMSDYFQNVIETNTNFTKKEIRICLKVK
jgi:hypothetical protein